MTAILRNCILIQRNICFQTFASQRCTITSFPFNVCNNKNVARNSQVKYFYTKDKSDENKKLIYVGPLNRKVFYVKLLSLSTSCLSIAGFPVFAVNSESFDNSMITIGISALVLMYVTATPLLLQYLIGRKYVTNMYFNSRNNIYIAETCSMFLTKIQTEFTEKDVHVPTITGAFTTCYANGKPLYVSYGGFTDLVHYHTIMGHYKSLDLFCIDDKDKVKDVQNNDKK